jgi:hypothetical protein
VLIKQFKSQYKRKLNVSPHAIVSFFFFPVAGSVASFVAGSVVVAVAGSVADIGESCDCWPWFLLIVAVEGCCC